MRFDEINFQNKTSFNQEVCETCDRNDLRRPQDSPQLYIFQNIKNEMKKYKSIKYEI